jgi:hypothetical protein
MKLVWALIAMTTSGAAFAADPPKPADIPGQLRHALKDGTPAEKEAALDTIRALKPLALVPDVIAAIEDDTPLPDHVSRDCKTGWVFVGHQAATVMGEIARAVDGVEIGMKPGQRSYQAYSFHNDLGQGAKLKKAGRLAEVRKNWAGWWDNQQRNAAAPLLPPALNAVLPKIQPGMTPDEVKGVLAVPYPKLERQDGPWSGQTGYVGFQLDDRHSILISARSDRAKGTVVSEEGPICVVDRARKTRVDITLHGWGEDEKGRR